MGVLEQLQHDLWLAVAGLYQFGGEAGTVFLRQGGLVAAQELREQVLVEIIPKNFGAKLDCTFFKKLRLVLLQEHFLKVGPGVFLRDRDKSIDLANL